MIMPRVRLSITLDPDLLEWVNHHVAETYEYKDRSHFVEVLIRRYRDGLAKQ